MTFECCAKRSTANPDSRIEESIMKNHLVLPLVFIAVAALAGCATLPASDSPLGQARIAYANAQANPQVTSLAAGELKQASDSLDKANNASSKGESSALVDHLAYVAKQQVAVAQETATQKAAELLVANASAERDRVRLDARTREADSAQRNAESAQRQAEASQRQSEASQRQSEASQRSAEASQRQSVTDRLAANDAQLSAQAARQQTLDAESHSQQLEAQLKDMEAKKTDRGMVITLGDVLFDNNRAQLKSGGMRNVQKLADFFKQYPQRNVMVEGFTDSTGSHSRNQELSDQRANSVREALLGMGIGTDRITSRGYGESYPVAGNDTAAGRQQNRRVEIIVSDNSGNIAPR
jgi:outer membrane protein OmpA-like peptidoglycan-associated protein